MSSWLWNPSTGTSSVAVAKNGTLVGTRPTLNFIEGTQISETIADDAGNSEVDITIASTGGAASQAGAVAVGQISTFSEGSQLTDTVYYVGGSFNSDNVAAANRIYHVAVNVTVGVYVTRFVWANGTVVAGTVDAGIYDEGGTLVISSGPQTQTGTSQNQSFDVTDTAIAAGTYYLSLLFSNATARFRGASLDARNLRSAGCFMQDVGSATLPATMTFTAGTGGSTFAPVLMAVPTTIF